MHEEHGVMVPEMGERLILDVGADTWKRMPKPKQRLFRKSSETIITQQFGPFTVKSRVLRKLVTPKVEILIISVERDDALTAFVRK